MASSYDVPYSLSAQYLATEGAPITNGADITDTLKAMALAETGAPLYFKVDVTDGWTLYCGYIDFTTYAITEFGVLEPDSGSVTIKLSTERTSLKNTGWTLYSGNVWQRAMPNKVYAFGATDPGISTPKPDHGIDWSRPASNLAGVVADFCWYWDPAGVLYVYSSVGNPQNYHAVDCFTADPVCMWYFDEVLKIVLGTKTKKDTYNLTLEGVHGGLMGGSNAANYNWPAGKYGGEYNNGDRRGLVDIHFTYGGAADKWIGSYLYVRCNTRNAWYQGPRVSSAIGGSGLQLGLNGDGFEHTYYGGEHYESCVHFQGAGCQTIHWEYPLVMGPYCTGDGWNGAAWAYYPNQNAGGPLKPGSSYRFPSFYERSSAGFQSQYMGHNLGGVRCRYGVQGGMHASWRWGNKTDLTSWTDLGGGLWEHTIPQQVLAFVTRNWDSDLNSCGDDGRQRNWGAPRISAAAVNSKYDWYSSDTTLTIYSAGDPTVLYDELYGITEQFEVIAEDARFTESGVESYGGGFPCVYKFSNYAYCDPPASPGGIGTKWAFMKTTLTGNHSRNSADTGYQRARFVDNEFVNAVTGGWDAESEGIYFGGYQSFTGNGASTTLGQYGTLTKGTFANISVGHDSPGYNAYLVGNNLIEYTEISGRIVCHENGALNPDYLDRVRFTGTGEVLHLQEATTTVYVSAVSAPSGAYADGRAGAKLYVNGTLVALPYYFQTADALGDEWWLETGVLPGSAALEAQAAQVSGTVSVERAGSVGVVVAQAASVAGAAAGSTSGSGNQHLRPDVTVVFNGWVAQPDGYTHVGAVNEVVRSDSEYVWTVLANQTLRFSLSGGLDPMSAINHVLRHAGKGRYTIRLLEDTTEIANWTFDTSTMTAQQPVLNAAQANSITDYGALFVEVTSGS